MEELESYEYICTLNRHLYGQLEECTVMISYLDDRDIDVAYWINKKQELMKRIEENLDKLEIVLFEKSLNQKQ